MIGNIDVMIKKNRELLTNILKRENEAIYIYI